ncbi:MAG: hypothetical protein GC185_09640 [Alphaproteobacteria bacterium]|nr:hypothetical protein [Alphaproteobacteria bacterium]
MKPSSPLTADFRRAARGHRQGEVLFVIDRGLGPDTLSQVRDFVAQSGLACKVSGAYFGMLYDLEPFDLSNPAASTGHHWNAGGEDSVPALDTLRRNCRDGRYEKPLHVIFIATAHTLGHVDDGDQFSYARAAHREFRQLVASCKDVTFDAVISKDTTGTQVTAREAIVPHPLELREAGDGNKGLQAALAAILGPHMAADAQRKAAAGHAVAEKLAQGAKNDVPLMKPLRVAKKKN